MKRAAPTFVTLVFVALVLLPCHAYSWIGNGDYCNQTGGYLRFTPMESIEVRLDPGVIFPGEDDPVEWTTHQTDIIHMALATYSHVPSARLHFNISSTPCTGGTTPDVGTICLWQRQNDDFAGMASSWADATSCEIERCRVVINTGAADDDSDLYGTVLHEFAHCLGVYGPANNLDWMNGVHIRPYGGANTHIGMSRDVRNAISFLYPFGSNFFFGHFDSQWWVDGRNSAGLTDVLVRHAHSTGNTIAWYENSRYEDGGSYGFSDEGEVSDDGDFGNGNTLPYVVGDFTGVGHDDIAAGLCSSPDPGDGAGDTVQWYVMESSDDNELGFPSSSSWTADFGNAEDFDLYKSGNFTGSDSCDDLLLVRNMSTFDCDASANECYVRLFVLRAHDDSIPLDGQCESFNSYYSYDVVVSDRSATTAWPWVVGDFYTADGLGCADVAYGEVSQTNPSTMAWHVIKGVDSNSDSTCDGLQLIAGSWASDMGDAGQLIWFVGNFGAPNASVGDDLARVKICDDSVEWYVAYTNGVSAFTNGSTVLSDMQMASDNHWRAKVFGTGKFLEASAYDDLITLVDLTGSGRLTAYIGRNNGGSPTSSFTEVASGMLPNSEAVWDQATDMDDWNTVLDNGGDDVRGAWWCETCNDWFNLTEP